MKIKHLSLAFFFAAQIFLQAEELRESMISEIATAALPTFSFVSGDRSWSGGYVSNNFSGPVVFDANTAYFVIQTKEPQRPKPLAISTKIRDAIVAHFHFPTISPSATWAKKQPEGIDEGNFGEAFLVSYLPDNNHTDKGLYLSVQVNRLNDSDYAVAIAYTTVAAFK